MKKQIIFFAIIICGLTAALSIFGISCARSFYQQEIATVQNIAGSVLGEYPQAEQSFMNALNDQDLNTLTEGAAILSRYGYDNKQQIKYNQSNYRELLIKYFTLAAVFGIVLMLGGSLLIWRVSSCRRRQEKAITDLLESYLNGNYNTEQHRNNLQQLNNSYFADLITKLGESLQIKTERLSEEQESTKALVTDISHQLKTPISALNACFTMYLESEDEQEKAEFLERSLEQIDRLETLTASLVNISRLEHHLIELNPTATTLREIIIAAVNTVYHKAAQKHIAIITPDFNNQPLHMDKKWTSEALVNILDNAVKYSPAGSQITLDINKLYSFVRVEIADQGIGIPKAERNCIFRRFFRGAHPEVQNQEGSGVGLYLARKILEDQGGTVSVRSTPGQGSIFIVQLPI